MYLLSSLSNILETKLHAILNAYVKIFADNMVFLIQAGVPILILYYGYSILSGRGSNATVSEMMWNMARIGMIFAFMQNAGNLRDLTIDFIQELKNGFIGTQNIWGLLDEVLVRTQKLSEIIKDLDASTFKVEGCVASCLVWIGVGITITIAAIVFIATEVGLTLLITSTPIFIGCLAYGFLKENFNGWLRSILSCIITLIFATLIVRLGIDIMFQSVETISTDTAQYSILTIGALNMIIGAITSSLLLVSKNMAGNIAGVAASAAIQGGMTAVAAGAARFSGKAAMAGGKAAMQGGRNLKSNISASLANRAKLAESVQKAAAERVKQANLKE